MAALAVVLLVPFSVGWLVERIAYGEARATDAVVAPLRAAVPRPAAVVRVAVVENEAAPSVAAEPAEVPASTTAAAAPKR